MRINKHPDDDQPVIKVEGLVNKFGDFAVHDGLDLEVRRGEILGVVGGSGTGKSVLMRSIIGLQRPDAGRIDVLGKTITELTKVLGGMSPASISVAALLSKPSSQIEPMAIEYVGREIAPDFVVGYGMDYAGYGRELDAIWVVNPDTEE
jgi:ABC-type glutathione transport system ATPase component